VDIPQSRRPSLSMEYLEPQRVTIKPTATGFNVVVCWGNPQSGQHRADTNFDAATAVEVRKGVQANWLSNVQAS
jgi:hypothetical protein